MFVSGAFHNYIWTALCLLIEMRDDTADSTKESNIEHGPALDPKPIGVVD